MQDREKTHSTTIEENLRLLKHNPAAMDEYQAAADGMMGQWWRALKFSDDYAAALRSERGEPWSSVAGDFGELHGSFVAWWAQRGMNLFGRTIAPPSVRKMTTGEQVTEHPDRPSLHLAIPLTLNRQALSRQVNQLVDEALVKLGLDIDRDDQFQRRDFYKDTRLHLPTITKMLDVWETRHKTQLAWEQIGERFAVSETSMPSPDDDEQTAKAKRRVMITSTQRLYRMAKALIDFAAKGDFPRVK